MLTTVTHLLNNRWFWTKETLCRVLFTLNFARMVAGRAKPAMNSDYGPLSILTPYREAALVEGSLS